MKSARLFSVRVRALVAGLVAALCHLSCQAILTAPTGSTLTLVVNPPFVEAHGGVAVVSALVQESIGTPVADGTVVQFFTDIGEIEEQGKTNDGVARVNFVSDSRSGKATVTATSGGITPKEVTITIGSALPARVMVGATPQRITDSRSSQIVATVLDESGNPVPNTAVFFSVTGSTERMESGGEAVFTDNDGRARDVLRTQYPREFVAKNVTVTATTANGVTGTAIVTID
jgi:Big-like domain-containing protein